MMAGQLHRGDGVLVVRAKQLAMRGQAGQHFPDVASAANGEPTQPAVTLYTYKDNVRVALN